ncbi:uncharacterized peroxidase-related enzyme [Dyadobacter sp. SG02]|uniref:carboxymuconolactone decarboxylase family protein n=1 Tax=Dyadobacter sp. SG02 TaxID=1855291 RepID=UPI0008C744BE|nr:carboxymuconolactone decarboxylase family protein [Dyadobacter sp. SG02]SEJ79624.1 uncharacterized peroxidase-related enzyme [Dyadobacter sp. SG02]
MTGFTLPTKNDVSAENQEIFSKLHKVYGMVPNIFAAFASSENGLANYFNFVNQKNSLTEKEKEVVNLVVSQVNECPYCISFHSEIARRIGFTSDEILSIRSMDMQFDRRLRAVGRLAQNIVMTKGRIIGDILEDFYEAGYNQGHVVDVVLAVGNIITLNLLYAITDIPIDWPITTV